MSGEKELNEILTKLYDVYLRSAARYETDVVRSIASTRSSVVDLLTEYARKDGTVNKTRMLALIRDLEAIEKQIRDVAETSLFRALEGSVDAAYADGFAAFQQALGKSMEFIETARIGQTAIFAPIAGQAATPKNLATYLANEVWPQDGLRLSDRVWNLAGEQREAISGVLRRGILRGDNTSTLVREIKGAYDIEAWKARRLALTEANVAYRTTMGYVAEQSELVKALKLHPGLKRSEKCVAVSRRDPHGLGTGVFLPSDTYIYSIHPNCSAYTNFILIDEEER